MVATKNTENDGESPPGYGLTRKRYARIIKVVDMRDGGMRVSEIAMAMGVTRSTIQRDLVSAKEICCSFVSDFNQQSFKGRRIRFLKMIRFKAMREYEMCKEGGTVKSNLLKTAIMAHEKEVQFLQECGMLTKEPQRVAFENLPFEIPSVRKKYLDWLEESIEAGEKNLGL